MHINIQYIDIEMQRITDIWRNLVQILPRNEQEPQIIEEEQPDERNAELEERFHNLYWIRVISLRRSSDIGIER